jgi:7,8-dihydropterin-6-yl-methyl-4-(beta-D-ribofuranosyl)aminobenzene 5'-phosphate synthase
MSSQLSFQNLEMGVIKRLKILCISETGWFDTQMLLNDIKTAGGIAVNQYQMKWPPFGQLHPENAAGSSALLEFEEITGVIHRFLFDCGWGHQWMEQRFAEEGIDNMLQQGQIEGLIISHEHFDHFWGIGAVLKHAPAIPLYLPAGFHSEGFEFIEKSGYTGQFTIVSPDNPLLLFSGVALVNFKMQTLLQVTGENVLYFNIENKGFTMVTGCGHGGVINLLEYARHTFKGGENIYAIYGGLHISPFEEWDADRQNIIEVLKNYPLKQVGCNHCTGTTAVQKMIAAGLPVVRGTARHGSQTDLFLGNGDMLEL